MVGQDQLPMVICDSDGRPVDLVHQNQKGYRKSLEQGSLWSLHPETNRLLPYHGGEGATVADNGTWYLATLSLAQSQTGGRPAQPHVPGRPAQPAETGVNSEADPGIADDDMASTPESSPTGVQSASGDLAQVMTDLAGVIASRHQDLPEGSYTTHLFASGSEKIRKKLGEEAVELILASTPKEQVSEAADLLYHLLVYFENEGITLSQVAAELENR